MDDDSHTIKILDLIVDCSKDYNPFDKAGMNLYAKSRQNCLRRTTSSYYLLIIWKNGEEEWIQLNRPNQSLSLENSEFSVAREIHDNPAFK